MTGPKRSSTPSWMQRGSYGTSARPNEGSSISSGFSSRTVSLRLKRALPTRDIRPYASYFYENPGRQHFVQRVSHRKAHGFEWQPPVSHTFSRHVDLCERAAALSLNRLSWFRCLLIPSALTSVSAFPFLSLSDPAISRHARTLAKELVI